MNAGSRDGALILGSWRSDIPEKSNGALQDINHLRGTRYTDEYVKPRDGLKEYFNSVMDLRHGKRVI